MIIDWVGAFTLSCFGNGQRRTLLARRCCRLCSARWCRRRAHTWIVELDALISSFTHAAFQDG
eukprot:8264147-Pyramimonas_sp.AAC.1